MNRGSLKGYLFIISGWTAAILLFILVRYFGLESVPQFNGLDFDLIRPGELFGKGIFLGIIMGSAYFALHRVFDRPSVRRRPYGFLILLQTLGNVGLVLLALLMLATVEVLGGETDRGWASIPGRLFSLNFLIILLYVTVVSFLFSLMQTVDRKFGPGNLWKLIIGIYHRPREEELIFMFLDLKGSTTHAERLGHARFSELIQDCFFDLSVVIDHRAQVYQYVGDEAVLFWDVDDGLDQANCLRAFYRFTGRLRDRDAYYREKYGISPVFKAGGNIGKATALEIGEIKREIAYLGDVLNTAARIQGKCNEYGEGLLISEFLKDRLTDLPADFDLAEIGTVELRGREQAVKIFAVHWDRERATA